MGTPDDLKRAWDILRDAIHTHDDCPDWETCPMRELNTAEERQATALRHLESIAAYLGICKE